MRLLPFMVVLLVLAPLAASPVHAGTEQSPEITDETNDVDATHGFGVHTTLEAPEVDITEVWFESNATDVSISWRVVDATHRFLDNEGITYNLFCDSGTDAIQVGVNIFPGLDRWADFYAIHANGTASEVLASFRVDGNIIHADGPRSFFQASTCVHTRAWAVVLMQTGPGSWSTPGEGVLWWDDHAPDSGYGRDAVFT